MLTSKIPGLKTHLLGTAIPSSLALPTSLSAQLQNRSMVVRRLKIFPLESIVRGYITGSAWSEYKKSGTVHGISMPTGLQESEKLERPLWTPSTKAEVGDKDENISPEAAREIVGEKYAKRIEELSLQVYSIVRDADIFRMWQGWKMLTDQYRQETMLPSAVSLSQIPNLSLVLMRRLTRLCCLMRCSHLTARASGLQTSTSLARPKTASTR